MVFTSTCIAFLAHPSRKLRMSYCDHSWSVVSPHRCLSLVCSLSAPLNDFSSEVPGPIFFKLHVEPSVKGGLKIYINGQGMITKVAAIPIYGKTI